MMILKGPDGIERDYDVRDKSEPAENGIKGLRAWFPLVAWILGTLIAVMLAYGAVVTRIGLIDQRTQTDTKTITVQMESQDRALQNQVDAQDRRLIRIEEKLDRLIEMQMRSSR